MILLEVKMRLLRKSFQERYLRIPPRKGIFHSVLVSILTLLMGWLMEVQSAGKFKYKRSRLKGQGAKLKGQMIWVGEPFVEKLLKGLIP